LFWFSAFCTRLFSLFPPFSLSFFHPSVYQFIRSSGGAKNAPKNPEKTAEKTKTKIPNQNPLFGVASRYVGVKSKHSACKKGEVLF